MQGHGTGALLVAALASGCQGSEPALGKATGTTATYTTTTSTGDDFVPCEPAYCMQGELGCACAPGDACNDGGSCEQSRCVAVFGTMALVPEGPFCMGCDPTRDPGCVSDELPAHEIWLSAFEIDRTEVTQADYDPCVQAGACPAPDEEGSCANKWDPTELSDHPVVCVDFDSATAFCEWAGKALPSEAQWEKAARGPDGAIYPWGDEEPTCELANFGPPDAECVDATVPVASYPAGVSPYGALDMAGNVWERVADWYFHDYYWESPHEDPVGPTGASARVIRGGSLSSVAEFQRSSFRDGSRAPWVTARNLGFRCARPSG